MQDSESKKRSEILRVLRSFVSQMVKLLCTTLQYRVLDPSAPSTVSDLGKFGSQGFHPNLSVIVTPVVTPAVFRIPPDVT